MKNKHVSVIEQPNNIPYYQHSLPTTIAMRPLRRPHRTRGALLLLRLRAHGCSKEWLDLAASREVHTPRSVGKRTASFRIAPKQAYKYHDAYWHKRDLRDLLRQLRTARAIRTLF